VLYTQYRHQILFNMEHNSESEYYEYYKKDFYESATIIRPTFDFDGEGILWLAGEIDATNPQWIEDNNIKAVVSCADHSPFPLVKNCLELNFPDEPDRREEIFYKKEITKAVQFIGNNINNGVNTCVYCKMGVNRSAAVVICYLRQKFKYSFNTVHKNILLQRFINLDFLYKKIAMEWDVFKLK